MHVTIFSAKPYDRCFLKEANATAGHSCPSSRPVCPPRQAAWRRVPAYSPQAVAEHTIACILTLNRNVHRAYNRVREGNFALDGLLGFDLAGKAAGLVTSGISQRADLSRRR